MAIEATITGNLGADPEVRWTQGGQQVTELRICATPRRQRRDMNGQPTNVWEDAGAPVWVRAALWGERHSWIAEALRKGDQVAVAGTIAKAAFTGRDGQSHEALEVLGARFLGSTAARRQQRASQGPAPAPGNVTGNVTGQPGGGSPWANQPMPADPPF